jgi:hypothetical protein
VKTKADKAVTPKQISTHLLLDYSPDLGIPIRENDDKQARKGDENLGSISYFDSQKSPHTPPARDLPIVFGNWMKPEKCPSPTQEEREILRSARSLLSSF